MRRQPVIRPFSRLATEPTGEPRALGKGNERKGPTVKPDLQSLAISLSMRSTASLAEMS